MKVIMFDLFGVICSPPYSPVIKKYIHDIGEQNRLLARLSELDLGEVKEEEIIADIAQTSGMATSEIQQAAEDFMKVDMTVIEYIRSLRQDYTLALLTNAPRSLVERGLGDHLAIFDQVFISSDLKMIKPHAEIFEYALDSLSVSADDVLFIDDREENVQAAEALGMNGFVFQDIASLKSYLDKLN